MYTLQAHASRVKLEHTCAGYLGIPNARSVLVSEGLLVGDVSGRCRNPQGLAWSLQSLGVKQTKGCDQQPTQFLRAVVGSMLTVACWDGTVAPMWTQNSLCWCVTVSVDSSINKEHQWKHSDQTNSENTVSRWKREWISIPKARTGNSNNYSGKTFSYHGCLLALLETGC